MNIIISILDLARYGCKPVMLGYFLSTLLLASDVFAAGRIIHEVSFTSQPSGAYVCNKVSRKMECYGKTPVRVKVDFNNVDESKRFIIQKTGYISAEQLIDVNSAKVNVRLKKREIIYNPDNHKDNALKALQKQVNARVSKVVYSSNAINNLNYQLFRPMRLYSADGKNILVVSVLLNNYSSLKEIKKIGRIRNENRRYKTIMEAFNRYGLFKLFDTVADSLTSLAVDEIKFEILHNKSKSALEYDQVEELVKHYTGSYYQNIGGSTQRVDTYDLYTRTRDVTKVKDQVVLINYLFEADLNRIRSNNKSDIYHSLDRIKILTNDTRKNKYEAVDLSIK